MLLTDYTQPVNDNSDIIPFTNGE